MYTDTFGYIGAGSSEIYYIRRIEKHKENTGRRGGAGGQRVENAYRFHDQNFCASTIIDCFKDKKSYS